MPQKLKIKTACTYYHKGYERMEYAEGQEVETDDEEFAAVAIAEGWATAHKAAKKIKTATPDTE